MKTPNLEPAEIARYSRHLTLPDVGVEGQLRLRDASVLVVGAGGLGSPVALYLAAAGVGRIGLVDFDRVDLSNLQRQVLYGDEDVGQLKVERAATRLAGINPHIHIEPIAERLEPGNALERIAAYDLVVDGTDNFATRYLVNDAAWLAGKTNVYGSIFRFEGQVSVFRPGAGPCYRCLFPEPPAPGSVPNCAEGGVLGILPGIVGTLQATEAIKQILGRGEPLVGRLLLFDALEMRFRELKLRRDPDCPLCGEHPTITEPVLVDATCEAPAAVADAVPEIDVAALKERLDGTEPPALVDVRTPEEWEICRVDGARLIPLSELPGRLAELDPAADTAVYCRTGVRSAQAVRFLREQGFRRAVNVRGGVHAWAAEIDPSMPRY